MLSPDLLATCPSPDDHAARALVPACLVALGRFAPRGGRMPPTGGLALAAAHRMVNRIHRHATVVRPAAPPAVATCLPERDVRVFRVADLADRGGTVHVDPANFPRGETNLSVDTLLGHQLGARAGTAHHLSAATDLQFDVVDHGAKGDEPNRQAVAHIDLRALARLHHGAYLQALGMEDVALLAVRVVQQGDQRTAVRVVLDRGHLRGHTDLVAPEVDPPVAPLVASAPEPKRLPALVVAAADPLLPLDEGLVRLVRRDLFPASVLLEAAGRIRGFEFLDRHSLWLSLHVVEEVDLALGQPYVCLFPIGAPTDEAALAADLAVHVHDPDFRHLDPLELGLHRAPHLDLVGPGVDDEGDDVPIVAEFGRLLGNQRPTQDLLHSHDALPFFRCFCSTADRRPIAVSLNSTQARSTTS